jgi:hypothetical protein
VWKGRPNPKKSAAVGLFQFFFGIFFFGFAIVWTVLASGAGLFALFGLPFLAVGAWMVSGPMRNYIRASRSYYAITDKRVVILTAGNNYKVISIAPGEITDYERTDKGDGSGSIRLRKTISESSEGTSSSVEFADGLWGIADVKGAADAIAALQTVD